jgi:hypothetical protein
VESVILRILVLLVIHTIYSLQAGFDIIIVEMFVAFISLPCPESFVPGLIAARLDKQGSKKK